MQKINVRNLLRMQKSGHTIRPLHIILGNRNLEKFGEIVNIPADSITYHPQFNAVDELSFSVYKERNGEIENLWDKIIDFKTVYVKEYNEWFEITVNVDESEKNTKKLITCQSLCEAELGQIILHNIEINTENDIARKEYTEPTVFYNPDKKNCSLLHRVLEKIPGYTIAYVDSTIMNIQRSFSIDGSSVYDFLTGTLAQEIGCIFIFDSNTRNIYVYDMETCCLKCGYRSEDIFDICPECSNTTLHKPYGKDTSIFIDKYNLSSEIQLTSDTDSIKNCFRVIGGDELINATLKNINPNGSNYIYYFNKDTLSDMPQELQNKIAAYNKLTNEYLYNKTFSLNSSLVNQYNNIISYIKKYYPDSTYTSINQQYTGWNNITSVYYNVIDLYSYLNNSMMPTWKQQEKTAKSQLALLTAANLSPIAVTDVSKISIYTANNAVLAMAKSLIDTSMYKVEILDGSTLNSQTWTGKFKIKSYSEDEDTAESQNSITIQINDDYIAYVNQQIDKAMGKVNDQGLQDIYKIDSIETFKNELHKYSAQRLTAYHSAYQTAINILTEQGIASKSSELYDSIYLPHYERFIALEAELSYRNTQIDTITGLEKYIENLIAKTHKELDFESYIGEKYWKLFNYYKREDDYTNENYISDGLSNEDLIQKANELLTAAKKELIKSGEKQFTISGTLQNLLLLTDKEGNRIFEPILEDFTLGNFIRTKIDDKIYIMRLADISISYSDLSRLSVTFSDAYKYGGTNINIVKEILSKSQSMATSYNSTVKQANQGEKANLTFAKLQKEGLDSALYNIHNSNSTAIFDEHGILIRSFDDVLDDYKDEQARISSNEFIYTTDRWRTAETAIGKQKYTLNGATYEEYGVNSKFVISGKIIAGDIYSSNYTTNSNGVCTSGTHFNLDSGDCAIGGDKLVYDSKKNKLSIKGVNIDWSSSSSPAISDIEDLGNRLDENANAISNNEKALIAYKAEVKLNSEEFAAKFTKMVTDETNRATKIETQISETAGKINWLIKDGTSESNMSLTSTAYDLIAKNINLTGKVTFNSFDNSTQNKFNTISQNSSDAKSTADKALIAANKAINTVDVEYYISTSSTQLIGGNWQTNAPKWTSNTYIWSRTKTLNENGQTSYSEPACISGYTPRKNVDYFDGGTSYIWIRYSNNANGANMTDTPSSSTVYMGTATTTNDSSAPTSPSQYKWVKYVGSDGVPGAAGKDGKTTYIHIAYSDSSDGKTGFDTVNGANKKFIGQYTDYTKEDSTNPSAYTWSLIKGKGIKSLIEQYYLSTSSVSQVNGSWSTNSPTWKEGYYIWTRTHITWEDNTTTDTTPVLANALNSANSNALNAKKTAQSIIDNIYTTNTTTIDGGKITTGTITADAIATNAIVSKNYVQGEKGSFLNLADGTFDSRYFKWDVNGKITATSGKIGDWNIQSGSIQTNNTNGFRGISMNRNEIKFYSWYDTDKENFVGGLTTSVVASGEIKDRRFDIYSDYGDKLSLCYKKENDSLLYPSIQINRNNEGSIYLFEKIDSDIVLCNNARIRNPNNQELTIWGNTEGRGMKFGVDYNSDGSVRHGWNFRPCHSSGAVNVPDLGTSDNPWDALYVRSGVSETSDRNRKNTIKELDEELCVKLTQLLKPSSYILNDGNSGRTHYGFIAQDVEETINTLGIDAKNFAALIKSQKSEIYSSPLSDEDDIKTMIEDYENEYEYSLRYNEFIPIAFKSLQYCLKEIKNLKNEIQSLKSE